MLATTWIALRLLAAMTVLTGLLYPLAVTGLARLCWPRQAGGSLLLRDGRAIGSELLAQPFAEARYCWPRPSAASYATVASGASNQAPTSAALQQAVAERRAHWVASHPGAGEPPPELLYASGSGLDPHLSPAAAHYQAQRIATARGLAPERVHALIDAQTVTPRWGLLGPPRVNVLQLNLALDALH